jgi:hypothetical protein
VGGHDAGIARPDDAVTELAILVPVLRRPHRVAPLLASAAAATPEPHVFVFICDRDDEAEQDAIEQASGAAHQQVQTLLLSGTYAQKINHAIRRTLEPWLFLAADDIDFRAGWFPAARALMSDQVGLVGTQDLCSARVQAGEHATHMLMARWYAEQPLIDGGPGPLCELYLHEFVDDELIGTAKARGAWAFAHDSIVQHLHPDNGLAPMDELYAERPARMHAGRRVWRKRRHLWETDAA